MDASITRDVIDLGQSDKQSIEHLLGTSLSAPQKVCIVAFTPGKEPDAQIRAQSADAIERILDNTAAHARQQGVTDAEIDEAVDEAMRAVRRRHAP